MSRISHILDNFRYKLLHKMIIPYVFNISSEPLVLRDLLRANKSYQDGLRLDSSIPGFRMSTSRSYVVFLLIWHIFIIPFALLYHTQLAKIDCHLLIVMAIIFTGMFFASYMIFKEFLLDAVSLSVLKKGWQNHFSHFDYDTHAKDVATIYSEALEKEISHKHMHLYIMDRLVEGK